MLHQSDQHCPRFKNLSPGLRLPILYVDEPPIQRIPMICKHPTNPMTRRGGARMILKSRPAAVTNRIPPKFRLLLPLARTWGIRDEVERCEFMKSTTLNSGKAMVSAVFPHLDELERWCAKRLRRAPAPREAILLSLLCIAATEAMFDAYSIS